MFSRSAVATCRALRRSQCLARRVFCELSLLSPLSLSSSFFFFCLILVVAGRPSVPLACSALSIVRCPPFRLSDFLLFGQRLFFVCRLCPAAGLSLVPFCALSVSVFLVVFVALPFPCPRVRVLVPVAPLCSVAFACSFPPPVSPLLPSSPPLPPPSSSPPPLPLRLALLLPHIKPQMEMLFLTTLGKVWNSGSLLARLQVSERAGEAELRHPLWIGSIHKTSSGFSTGSMSRLTTTASLSLRTSTHSSGSFGLALISWWGTNGGT